MSELIVIDQSINGGASIQPPSMIITKRAFMDRFPLSSDGICKKYDLMTLFMTDDGYAASLGVTGATLYSLRAIMKAGTNRLDAVPYIDLSLDATENFVKMLSQSSIPETFRLTSDDVVGILNTPANKSEAP
jgi:hypothetical protein